MSMSFWSLSGQGMPVSSTVAISAAACGGQAVGADEPRVARLKIQVQDVRLGLFGGAQRAGDEVALWVGQRLLRVISPSATSSLTNE
jgi:hypothetical protein